MRYATSANVLGLLAFAALSGSMHAVAHADIVRADGATATSEFSSSYRVLNAINGSGLPTNFGPLDPHATYATNNHWTTRGGETIGESATFTFNSPKTLGGMHMWAHRSNGVASNPYYAVTLFDLVLRDAQGNLLAEFKNLTGQANIQVAQPVAFDVTANVSSIQFIVRATLNNNVSPYTGLAEVLFETCFPATSAAPLSVSSCPSGTINFQANPGGSGPFEYGWETLDDNGNWVEAQNGTFEINGVPVATITGADAQLVQVTLDPALGTSQALSKWRCRITNPCSDAVSEPADLVICPTDFDCTGFVDIDDYTAFVHAFEEGIDAADFDGTGFVDIDDFVAFVQAFENGC